MHFSLSWLQEIFNNKFNSAELADGLTRLGFEVDSVERIKSSFEGLVVAKVLSAGPHPDADRLKLTTVFDGKEELQVVCGAKNCREGLLTVLCPVGSSLTDKEGKRHKIKKGKIRGVESFGMLAALEEMGLEEESEGIVELSDDLQPGEEIAPYFEDEVLEISFTPNLGHAMSVQGIAREISAWLKIPFKLAEMPLKESPKAKIEKHVSLKVEDEEKCPHYAARLIANVSIGPSPMWLQQRLKASGIKSINNVVDATNYVLHEMGQPLHAFDFDKIDLGDVVVRSFDEDVSIKTLDGVDRTAAAGTLFICDGNKPIALAGIMGGENSCVDDETQTILLEAAVFDPGAIRRASKALGLYTDASKHFERGVDAKALKQVLDRAAALIVQIAGGEVSSGLVSHTSPIDVKTVEVRPAFINRLLGTSIETKEIEAILTRLDFKPKLGKNNVITVQVPSYRNDVGEEIDLVEEVARFYGFDSIIYPKPDMTVTDLPHDPLYEVEQKLHTLCRQEGLSEILTCDLISPKMQKLNSKSAPELSALNSVSLDQSVLRSSLLAGHLQVLKHNQGHQIHDLKVYEIGKTYHKNGECFEEETKLAISLMGHVAPHHFDVKPAKVDFFHLKGVLENLFSSLGIEGITFKRSMHSRFHPGIQADLVYEDQVLGQIAEVHPSELRQAGLKQPVLFAELSVVSLLNLSKPLQSVEPLPSFPGSERDWTLTCMEELEVGHLMRTIEEMDSRLLKEVSLLDIYRSEAIGLDRKNVTLRFVYRNDKKTISFEATEIEHAKITSDVLKKMKNLIIQPN